MEDATHPIYFELLLLLAVATTLITVCHRLRIAPLLAFIATGALFGPTGFGLMQEDGDLTAAAELGLSFLLFLLGLEFSVSRLIALRQTVFGLGFAQVFICSTALAAALYWWGLSLTATVLLAGGLSLSSTAIVSKELSELRQLATRRGEIAIAILLFQDLCAVAMLIAVPLLSGSRDGLSQGALLLGMLETAGLMVLFFAAARYLLPRILIEVSRHKSDELLVLTAILIVLACATLTSLIGLSMELGAFLAGMLLGESSFKHQLEADIRPFRDLLLGLFFITIGLLVDLELLWTYWFRILAAGLALVVFKAILVAGAARLVGETWHNSLATGLTLGQGSEFLFALMALATRGGLVTADVAAFLISVTIVSMVLTPVLIRHGPAVADRFLRRFGRASVDDTSQSPHLPDQHRHDHVLILGFGRVGQAVARFLKPLGIDYLVLESDIACVAESAAAGEPVFYGDTTRRDILKAAGVQNARLVIVSFDNGEDAKHILELIREANPEVAVLVRTRDDTDLEALMERGATAVIPETHEASLTLVSHALLIMEVPASKVEELIGTARRERYRML